MVAKKPISREYRIYLAIWRKAYLERDKPLAPPVVVNASSLSMAIAMRQGMYRAIKPYRNGTEFDPELEQAAELFVVTLPKVEKGKEKEPCKLVLTPRMALSELELELAGLGLDEGDLLIHEERIMASELSELSKPPETIELPKRPETPFYSRDE